MRQCFNFFCVLCVAALCCFRAAQAAAPPAPLTKAWLEGQVAQLGAEAFADRQAASQTLERVGSEAVPALLIGLKCDDLEIRRRALPLLLRAEKQAAEFFEKLGASVERKNTTDRVDIVSFHQRDVSKVRDEHLRELVGLPWLERVFLNDTSVGDAGMVHLGRLTRLDYLSLTDTQVTDIGLAHLARLTNLDTLHLSSTKVVGAGLVHLEGMKNLRYLTLYKSKLTDAGLAAGIRGLAGIEGPLNISIAHTQVTDDCLACLEVVRCSMSLNLSHTRITDRGVARLKKIPVLCGVTLSNTAVTDEGCAHLVEIKSLQGVSLCETRVTSAGLRKLEALPRLERLKYAGIKLTQDEFRSLCDVMPSRVSLWGGRDLTGRGRAKER